MRVVTPERVGPFLFHSESSENGVRLTEFLTANNLRLANSYFPKPKMRMAS